MRMLAGLLTSFILWNCGGAFAGPADDPEKAVAIAASTAGAAPTVAIRRAGAQASARGPEANFTGSVRVDMPFGADAPSHISGGSVTFEPGARTAWHSHPLGQTLIVTAGTGWVQRWGGPVEEIRLGDVVWIPTGVKHWHGATATTAMTHIAIAERLDGKAVDWMEKVGDDQYGPKPPSAP